MIGFKEWLKKAWEGGKESRIMEVERGVETLICLSRLDATRAEWMYWRAFTRRGAALGRLLRISEPTQIVVMLVDG